MLLTSDISSQQISIDGVRYYLDSVRRDQLDGYGALGGRYRTLGQIQRRVMNLPKTKVAQALALLDSLIEQPANPTSDPEEAQRARDELMNSPRGASSQPIQAIAEQPRVDRVG